MMKMRRWIITGLVFGVLTTYWVSVAPAEDIKLGDTAETVIRELGKPQGRISAGIYEVYLYDRGKVELVSNRVTTVELIPAEEATARRLAQEKRQQEAAQQAQDAQERRRVEGNRILAERLADTSFRAQSAGEQLDYWDVFKSQYPEIDIGSIYANLSRQYQAEVEQAKVREQLADLEQRTAAAEARALRAERAAEEAYYSRPTVTYVPVPWIQGYHHDNARETTYRETVYHEPTFRNATNTFVRPIPIVPSNITTPAARKIQAVNTTKAVGTTNATGNVKSGGL